MKPHRLTLTNALVMGYGLDKQIHHMHNPRPATQAELEMYHDHDYVDFLSRCASRRVASYDQPTIIIIIQGDPGQSKRHATLDRHVQLRRRLSHIF